LDCLDDLIAAERASDTTRDSLGLVDQAADTHFSLLVLPNTCQFGNDLLVQAAPVPLGALLQVCVQLAGQTSYR
jgi:hypothetical protein